MTSDLAGKRDEDTAGKCRRPEADGESSQPAACDSRRREPEPCLARDVPPRDDSRLLALLLVVATCAAYANSLAGRFILDDELWITHHREVINLPEDLSKLTVNGRPLVHLSVALNYAWGGLEVRGFHVFNLGVHLLAGLLLFGIARRTIQSVSAGSGSKLPAARLAFAIALLWLVHPLQTESVTYIIQRCESMMGLFFLLCLYCLVRGSNEAPARGWYAGCIAACALGLTCKEVMVTAPPVLLLYDRAFLAPSWREVVRRRGTLHALLFSLAVAFVAATWQGLWSGGEDASAGFGYSKVTPLAYLQSQPGIILHYLRLAFWPHPLCLDYMWRPAASLRQACLPAGMILLLLSICLMAWSRKPGLAFLGLSFFLVLAPTSSILPIADLAVEHRMYLPLAAVVALVVLAVYGTTQRVLRDPRSRWLAPTGLLALASLCLMSLTRERNRDYCDPLRIWSKVLQISPQNYRAFNALGDLFGAQGDYGRQQVHYEQAIACKPDFERLYVSLAACHLRQGELDRAADCYRRAIALKPDYLRALNGYASLLLVQHRWREAERYCRQTLALRPNHAEALQILGTAVWRLGDAREAAAAYRQALQSDPDMVVSKVRLAWILATAPDASERNGAEAVRLAKQACQTLGERNYRGFEVLTAAYAEGGRFQDACAAAATAIRVARAAGNKAVLPDLEAKLQTCRDKQPIRNRWPAGMNLPAAPTSGNVSPAAQTFDSTRSDPSHSSWLANHRPTVPPLVVPAPLPAGFLTILKSPIVRREAGRLACDSQHQLALGTQASESLPAFANLSGLREAASCCQGSPYAVRTTRGTD